MQVTFISDAQRRLDISVYDQEREIDIPITFAFNPVLDAATYTTSDKKIIRLMLAYPGVRKGTITLDTPEDAVAQYLMNDAREDFFSFEQLEQYADETVKKLGEYYKIVFKEPAMIRAALVGRSVTKLAEKIIESAPAPAPVTATPEEKLDQLLKEGVVVKQGRSYIEAATSEPIGLKADALRWADIHLPTVETE